LATKSRQATQDYLRFNPSDAAGWKHLAGTDLLVSALLFREGRVSEALQTLRGATQDDCDPGNTFNNVLGIVAMSLETARWEAQRGNRDAADQALVEARHIYESISARRSTSEILHQRWTVFYEAAERRVRQAFDDDSTVYTLSTNAVPRLDKLWKSMANRNARVALLNLEREALEQAARAALNLERHTEAETTARALLSLSVETGESSAYSFLAQPFDLVWGRVLLAQALVEQGRTAEALKALEPALAHYRDAQAKGAAHVTFRQHFARALYVQALAEPADSAGTASAHESLEQALALLQGLSDEARQLHDSKELLSWIAAAQKQLTRADSAEGPTLDK